MLNYSILNHVLPLDADALLKLEQLDAMAASNVDGPVINKQYCRDGTSNLIHPICEAPVEYLEEKRKAVEGRRDPIVGEAGGVTWFKEAEGGVASVGGGCEGGGGERGINTGCGGQWSAIEDHASREERDNDQGFYDDTEGRSPRIQVTIVSKWLNEGGSGSHECGEVVVWEMGRED